MVSSRAYPDLERKPGGPDNWVEAAGGLPSYIERIAKHLHYEKGMSISRSIAVAVNTVKRWAKGGTVTKYGTTKRITPKTQALAAAAVASWEAKKKAGRLALSAPLLNATDLSFVDDATTYDLLAVVSKNGVAPSGRATLHSMDIKDLAERANQVSDPQARAKARQAVLDLSSSITPRNARGRAKDGRPSYKRQGKWGHGFVPLDQAAKEAKAKGSPVAMRRMNRLFDGKRTSRTAAGGGAKPGEGKIAIENKSGRTETADRVSQLRGSEFNDAVETPRARAKTRKDESKQSRITERARQDWASIDSSLKTVRNGKRYVVADFGGKKILTEWVGGVTEVESSNLNKRKVQANLTEADAMSMTTAEIRQLLKNPRTPGHVRKILNKALRVKVQEIQSRG